MSSALLMFYYFCIIYSNFFLYKYLATMTENNKAIKETDKKKDRKRNFIPARASIMCAVVMVISYIMFALLYSIQDLDAATRAFLLCTYADCVPCIIGPGILILGAPAIRRKFKMLY